MICLSLDNDQQLNVLQARLIGVNCLPPQTTVQTLHGHGIVRVFETNLNMSYVPERIYHEPLLSVGMTETTKESTNKIHAQADLLAHWRHYAPEATFGKGPSDRTTLLSPPAVTELANQVRPFLRGDK